MNDRLQTLLTRISRWATPRIHAALEDGETKEAFLARITPILDGYLRWDWAGVAGIALEAGDGPAIRWLLSEAWDLAAYLTDDTCQDEPVPLPPLVPYPRPLAATGLPLAVPR